MIDRAKLPAAKPGQEMSRGQLVRAHFEVQRDLHWAETLEPRFRRQHLEADAMRHYREAWNVFSEDRDWNWWKEEARHSSNEELKAEISECMAELKAIEMRQPGRAEVDIARQTFQDILSDESEQPTAEPTQTRTKARER